MTARLPAHTDPETRGLLADPLLHELGHGLGGPYHVLLPSAFDANAAAFHGVFGEAGVRGRVYYAKKANKAAVFAERAAVAGLGVDVASRGELREALAAGVRGEDLIVTGPAKADELLRVAVLQGALIAVDALDELDRLEAVARELGRKARALLRVLPPKQPHSRFGLDEREVTTALVRIGVSAVSLEGFSFHLSGYDVPQRADLAATLVRLCRRTRQLGLPVDSISIGGGFAVDYVGAEDWREFEESSRAEHFHAGKRFGGGFYPYHSPVAGADALRAILAAVPSGESVSLAEVLRSADVRLLVEPGRALLDRAGFTVFRVQGVKERDGYAILTVDGSSLSLSEQWFDSEFLPDPALVPAHPETDAPAGPFPACVGAATCLESDLLTWRKIPFPAPPAVGDLLVYLNTAGYQMDSNESPFHELPLPPKVVVEPASDRFRWHLDRRPA
ncbi:alanine racemase [Streptomyces sp. NPDC051985]|uniref:alanine racemase n=1 Tax=Streptomyces sp. NPDC051985 TaxID=3155807 RepID=UPI003437BEC0